MHFCLHFICNFRGSKISICMQECSGITNLQTELNYLNLSKAYCIFTDLGLPGSGVGGRWVGGYLGVINFSQR